MNLTYLYDVDSPVDARRIASIMTLAGLASVGMSVRIIAYTPCILSDLVYGLAGSVYLLNAPIDIALLKALCEQFPDRKFLVNNHASFGAPQAGVMQDVTSLVALSNELSNLYVGFVHRDGPFIWPGSLWLPNVYKTNPSTVKVYRGGEIRVGVFGRSEIGKNLLNAALGACIAAKRLNRPVTIYMEEGTDSLAHQIDHVIANFGFSLVRVSRQSYESILQLYSEMDLMINVSFSESYLLTAIDGMRMGVRSVLSNAIPYATKTWTVMNADSPVEIAGRMIELLEADAESSLREGIDALNLYNDKALQVWQTHLQI